MRIDIITIFPKMFSPVLNESILKRAQKNDKVKIFLHDLRDYSDNKHRKIDDRPFGGGSGMVMQPGPIFMAVEQIKTQYSATKAHPALSDASVSRFGGNEQISGRLQQDRRHKTQVILLCPQGERLTQKTAKKLAKYKHLILICGHYEGIDERVRQHLVDKEISVGDYVLTGGELPAMVLIDCLVRLVPGVLGCKNSLNFESFEGNLLEYPQYTRPAIFHGLRVPAILLSGDHKKIESWRRKEALKRTKQKRPDLLQKAGYRRIR